MSPTGYEPLFIPKAIDDDIWIVDGPLISFYKIPFPTRMTVVRLGDNSLFLHSPVELTEELRTRIDGLGEVRHLIAPNWIHYAYLPQWQAAYPLAISWAAPGVKERAKTQGVDIRVDHLLTDDVPGGWRDELDHLVVSGSKVHVEVVFFHRASKTLILADLIENFEPEKIPFWLRPLTGLAKISAPDGQMPLDMRLTFCFGSGGKGLEGLRAAVNTMLSWEPEQIVISHGRWFEEKGTEELRRAFRWVL